MIFNKYTWELYKQTPNGQRNIKEIVNFKGYDLLKKYNPIYANFIPESVYDDYIETIYCYGVSDYNKPTSLNEAKDFFIALISLGIMEEGEIWIKHHDFRKTLDFIQPISFVLSRFASDFFFPYLFMCRIFDLYKIADIFGIELPDTPSKIDYQKRCMYYWDLCEKFYNFRMENNLSPEELCAFLYDFAPNFIKQTIDVSNMPNPSHAWFIGGLMDPIERDSNFTFWQANPETKKGDILIHYETAPVSAITCLWIAQTDGVRDPFFHYYSNTYISNKIDIPNITLKELKHDNYFSTHPFVRKNFQGINGSLISGKDYNEILRIIKSKGFDTNKLPNIYTPTLPNNITIERERDVETKLLEPLLKSMGWHENTDYIRQLPIHAGRGHRIFPDYALHFNNKPDEEKAKVLIEVKYYMKNNQEIEAAFLQAFSYAKLLESNIIVLCDKECIIVYEKGQGFSRNEYKKYYWENMSNTELFNELKNKLK